MVNRTRAIPQTTKGASENQPWIQFMRHCAAEYHAQRAAAHEAAAKDAHTAGKDVKKKARKPATSTGAKAKAKPKPITEKDQKILAKVVKDEGKKRAKEKAAKAAPPNVPRRVRRKQADTTRDVN